MDRPTAQDVRSALPTAVWENLGFPAADPYVADEDALNFLVQLAVDWVEATTGRKLDATLPPELERIALMAVALTAASIGSDMSADQLEAMAGASVLQSFSADGYSESYRSGGGAIKDERDARMVHPWPLLNRLLWALMTPAKAAYWMAFLMGGGIPSWGVVEMDWTGQNRWGGIPGAVGGGGLAGDELRGGLGSALPPPLTPGFDGPLD